MIHITDKKDCCGCAACVQRCPKQCIAMREDEEGFLYPRVDETLCIDCGLCEKVCPVAHPEAPRRPLEVYAAKNRNEEQRLRSSSGGIFILLAERTIRAGGVVFGARFDRNWEVKHTSAETLDELEPLLRSKYLQSRIGNTYQQAKDFLKQGRQVLFVGTSCQIAGLKRFLGREYDHLLAVDFVCHGVPSPGVWRTYLNELRESHTNGRNTAAPSVTAVNFREKQLGGYEWAKYGFTVRMEGTETGGVTREAGDDPFMRLFLNNYILRPSCYACPAKDGRSMSDITMADFWGISGDDRKGTSMVVIHTRKGENFCAGLDWDKEKYPLDIATKSNPAYFHAPSIPPKRQACMETIHSRGIQRTARKYLHVPLARAIYRETFRFTKRGLGFILRKAGLRK